MSYEVTITYYKSHPSLVIREPTYTLIEIDGKLSIFYTRKSKDGSLKYLHREEGKDKESLIEFMKNDPMLMDIECKININVE